MKKKMLMLCIILAMIFAAGCQSTATDDPSDEPQFTAGTYSGTGIGINGELTVAITMDESGTITAIDASANSETDGLGKTALEILSNQVLEGQTSNFDLVSGATVTSLAFRTALNGALNEAGASEKFSSAPAYEVKLADAEDITVDVVIAGTGISGLMAAIGAAEQGLSVVVLEKNLYPGGDTLIAAGAVTGVGNRMQLAAGGEPVISFDPETQPISYKLFEASGRAMDTMMDYGVEMTETTSAYSSFAPGYEKGGGAATRALVEKAESLGVTFYFGTPAVEIVNTNGTAAGLVAERMDGTRFTVSASAVVLATGGFQSSPELVEKYTELSDIRSASNPGNTGDAFKMVEAFDAALFETDLPGNMLLMTANTNRALPFSVSLGIIVDEEGNRFTNETGGYNSITKAALSNGINKTYIILDESAAASESIAGNTYSLVAAGSAYKFSSAEEAAEKYGLTNLAETLNHYNEMAANGEDTDFGRRAPVLINEEELYVIETVPALYASYTGILTDDNFHVLNNNGESIPGLYAIGACMGSIRVLEGAGEFSPGLTPAMASGYLVAPVIAADLAVK